MTDYRSAAADAANRYGVPAEIFLRQINAESGWQPNALSSAGAIGLGQLMPATAAELGVDPNDPIQNLDGAARYMAQQYDRFGDWRLAAAAYNAGAGNVEKYGGVPPFKETENYVSKIFGGEGVSGGNALAAYQSPEAGGFTGQGQSSDLTPLLLAALTSKNDEPEAPKLDWKPLELDPEMFKNRRQAAPMLQYAPARTA